MQEIYKDIVGYEGLYQVSNLGNVKSFHRNKDGTIIKLKTNKYGYNNINLCKKGNKKFILVHRLVATLFIQNKLNKPCVNHINGIKNDNRVQNLEWCTYSENSIHANRLGLTFITPNYGENNGKAKLTKDKVLAIRKDIRKQREIAKDYNVSLSTINFIKNRKIWNNI